MCKSLNISGYFDGKEKSFNIEEIKNRKIVFDILPYNLNDEHLLNIIGNYKPDNVFIFKPEEVFYCPKIHEFLNFFIKSVGKPVWIPNLKTHICKYSTMDISIGDYKKALGTFESEYVIGPNGMWNINFTINAPTLYYGICDSPYIFFICPFDNLGIYINTKALKDNKIIEDKEEEEERFIMGIEGEIDRLGGELIENQDGSYNDLKREVDIDTELFFHTLFKYLKIRNAYIIEKLIEPKLLDILRINYL